MRRRRSAQGPRTPHACKVARMCNRYVSPQAGDMERYWDVGGRTPWGGTEVFPLDPGPLVRRSADATKPHSELVQWLYGTQAATKQLIRLTLVEAFDAEPVPR